MKGIVQFRPCIKSLTEYGYCLWYLLATWVVITSQEAFHIAMQNHSKSAQARVSPINVPVIIYHFIFISSISTVHKNTHHLGCSNQLFQHCPILKLGLELGNLAREPHCRVPLFHGWGKVLLFGLYLMLIISPAELDAAEFNNSVHNCCDAVKVWLLLL